MSFEALRVAVLFALAGCGGAPSPATREVAHVAPPSAPPVAASAPVAAISGSLRAVVAGGYHTCAIVDREGHGEVLCWGDNRQGQVGDGTFVTRAAPTVVAGIGSAKALALGEAHSCALHDDGSVSCWGDATAGAIGVVATEDRPTPLRVEGVRDAIAIVAGANHTCALAENGRVTCWGDNDRGQLGIGRVSAHEARVEAQGLRDVVEITAAGTSTCARTRSGETLCFGENTMGQLGIPHDRAVPGTVVRSDQVGFADGPAGCREMREERWLQTQPVAVPALASAVHVALGPYLVCAIASSGVVRCAGNNLFGQLGTQARELTSRDIDDARGASAITVGGGEVCALRDGRAICWGQIVDDPRPNETVVDYRAPTTLVDLPSDLLGVSAGDKHSCAFTSHSIHCWGDNQLDQLGIGVVTNSDIGVVGRIDATQISTGVAHGCGVLPNGTVACWTEQDPVGHAPPAMPIAGIRDAARVISGGHSACAIGRSGEVQCFTAPRIDEYGGGHLTPAGRAHRIASLANIVDLAPGALQTCALDSSGGVSCWAGSLDDLFLSPGAPRAITPVAIAGLVAEQVVVAVGFACARTPQQTVACWGDPGMNQLGLTATPREVAGLRDVVALAAGTVHVCALLEDGSMRCWGGNDDGQLGDGSMTTRARPVRVAGLDDVTTISAAGSHTCALRRSGRVACWGENGAYQLGIGSGPSRSSPQDLPGIEGATALAAGMIESCVIDASRHVRCWSRANGDAQNEPIRHTSRAVAVAMP